jgi:hypothetical protein
MRRNRKPPPPSSPVQIDLDGKSYVGGYFVERGMITVSYGLRQTTTQLGGSTAAGLARILLSELVRGNPDPF